MSWARLLKRVFDIDVEHRPNCGGSLSITGGSSIAAGNTEIPSRALPSLTTGDEPVPSIGTEVWVLFEEGDVTRPVWIDVHPKQLVA